MSVHLCFLLFITITHSRWNEHRRLGLHLLENFIEISLIMYNDIYILHILIHIKARVRVGFNFPESYLYWEINIGLNSGLIETILAECFCILKGECSAPSALHGQNAVVPRSQQISGTGGNPVVKSPSGDQSRTKGQWFS